MCPYVLKQYINDVTYHKMLILYTHTHTHIYIYVTSLYLLSYDENIQEKLPRDHFNVHEGSLLQSLYERLRVLLF